MKFMIWVGLPYSKFMEVEDALAVHGNKNIRQLLVIGKEVSLSITENDEGNPQISWRMNDES